MRLLINDDSYSYLKSIEKSSIDLIITDPPYGISKKSYFGRGEAKNKKFNKMSNNFGYWDINPDIEFLFSEFSRILKSSGSIVMFYDVWKSNELFEHSQKYGFKQPRICIWSKNNPVPINSTKNYLSNSAEFIFTFVKGKNPTFNSKYDKGIYNYPICHGKERMEHPTQKPLDLIMDLISKHSNPNDLILDPFSGTSTTAEACEKLNRDYICIEKDEKYYKMGIDRIDQYKQILI